MNDSRQPIHAAATDPRADVADEQLLADYCQRGDRAAFEKLVKRYEKPVFNYLLHYLRSRPLAEEVHQATLLRVSEKCATFAEGRKFRPWLYSIATHLAVDALRREGRHRAVSLDAEHGVDQAEAGKMLDLLQSASPSPVDLAAEHERAEWTRRAVAALDEEQRLAVLLIFFQGLKYREVAQILSAPEGTIKSRVHNALAAINKAWRRDHQRPQP